MPRNMLAPPAQNALVTMDEDGNINYPVTPIFSRFAPQPEASGYQATGNAVLARLLKGIDATISMPRQALMGRQTTPDDAMGFAGAAMTGGMPFGPSAGSGTLGVNVFHGTQNPEALKGLRGFAGGLKMMDGLGPHVGTAEAANARLAANKGLSVTKAFLPKNENLSGAYVMPFDITPTKPFVKSNGKPYTESELQTKLASLAVKLGFDKYSTRAYSSAYGATPKMKAAQAAVRDHLKLEGYDAIPYVNSHEDRGSISYVILNTDLLQPKYAP